MQQSRWNWQISWKKQKLPKLIPKEIKCVALLVSWVYIHMCTLNMCSLLHLNYMSIKLLKIYHLHWYSVIPFLGSYALKITPPVRKDYVKRYYCSVYPNANKWVVEYVLAHTYLGTLCSSLKKIELMSSSWQEGIRRMCCEGRKLRHKAMCVWNEANPMATMSENRAVTSPLLPERAAPEEPCLSLWAKMVTVTRTETWVSRNVLPSASKTGHPAETIGLAIGNYPIWTQLFSTNWDWMSLNYSFTWTDSVEAGTKTFPT